MHTKEQARLQRLQLAAALAVGVVMLAVVLLRAWRGDLLPAGWWRP